MIGADALAPLIEINAFTDTLFSTFILKCASNVGEELRLPVSLFQQSIRRKQLRKYR